ncbi:sensor histidine kinase [Shewanella gelidii]|uniref:histidine kinase n=1 Tax=Shewanella gelidii TaxID=1642821 RepID=A0A917JPH3_9GAMM|nr:PhnD/SsuA/transferrin family substrate-binding protein [Shewanella gelidii]MCL1097593.1 PhnD/SsuA/transferrin family substrate-binding protein [Shewanella gelidii]GGI80336.1 sensor histidine kinase [Shewanella gelidii]
MFAVKVGDLSQFKLIILCWIMVMSFSATSVANVHEARPLAGDLVTPTEGGALAKDQDIRVLKVGVLANHGVQAGILRWQPMMDYLTENVPNRRFEVVPLDFDEMSRQLLANEIQFIVTNPGQYLNLSNTFPLSWLATMKSRKHLGTTFAIGSTIIVPASSSIQTLADLEGVSIVASDPQALGGYQAVRGLLLKSGYVPEQFFENVRFLGFPLEPIVYQVRDGTADAAITPFCTLEEMVEEGLVQRKDFRVIHEVTPEGYDCAVSTALYPNWSFAAAESVSPETRTDTTLALFDLQADHPAAITARTLGWTAPISQLKVIKLFQDLHIQTTKIPAHKAVWQWMVKNKEWGAGLLGLFVLATLYHLWLEYKFRQKSEFLLATERELQDKALQVEKLQSAAILGEIGAGLAHELNQPIAAINQYSEGAMMQIRSPERGAHLSGEGADTEALYEVLQKINSQSMRAGAVVHRIRGLLKRRRASVEALDLQAVIQESIVLLEHEFKRADVTATVSIQGQAFRVFADEVGLSQLMVNLFKNSLDALQDIRQQRPGKIQVQVWYESDKLHILVVDNGSGLKEEAKALVTSFRSTKEQGLGLGLAICKDVVTQHHGTFTIENCSQSQHDKLPWPQGCVVTVTLPRDYAPNRQPAKVS